MSFAYFLLSFATLTSAFAFTPASRVKVSTENRFHFLGLPSAILFDCDGVLADTEPDGHRVAFNIAFKENGIDEEWSVERYGKLLDVGGGKERMTAHWNEVGWPSQIPEQGREDKVKSLHLQKTDIFMKLIDEGKIPLRPGVLRLVDEAIAKNVQLAVCSTSNEKAVVNLVTRLMGQERASKFSIFAGDIVKAKKPAPDVYNLAVDTMKLDRATCVIIEDSHIGVGAAVAANIACLVTKSSFTQAEDFTGAKLVVNELGDDASSGVSLETLAGLLNADLSDKKPVSSWDPIGHIERVGVSWTGARFGDKTPTETHESSGIRSTGSRMERHVETGGVSWAGARFGEDVLNKPPILNVSSARGIGVNMAEHHIEKGGASWTGARFGDSNINKPTEYTASETYETKPEKSPGATWDAASHIEAQGADNNLWSGARFSEEDGARRCSPTPSQWHE